MTEFSKYPRERRKYGSTSAEKIASESHIIPFSCNHGRGGFTKFSLFATVHPDFSRVRTQHLSRESAASYDKWFVAGVADTSVRQEPSWQPNCTIPELHSESTDAHISTNLPVEFVCCPLGTIRMVRLRAGAFAAGSWWGLSRTCLGPKCSERQRQCPTDGPLAALA